jgi:superfamily II DNA helicase RecQ
MALRFFTVPVQSSEEAEAEVNAFLSGHRVLTVDRHWVDLGGNSFWALCIDFLPGRTSEKGTKFGAGRSRIDYKEVLSADEFEVFAKLRDVRKEIAQAEAIPVYTVFTNDQFARIVQQRCRTKSDLMKIDGIGTGRVDKYADRILPLLEQLKDSNDETSGEPA